MSYFREKIKAIYDYAISEAIKGQDEWRKVLYLAGQLYRFEFDNILMIYAQRPDATLVADYDTWKKVNRYVKRGSKGIAVFPSQALEPYVYHVFDVSDTGGRQQNLTWYFTDENVKDYKEEQDITGLEFSVSVTVFERDESDIKGIARLFIEDCFVINNVTIIQGKDNLFVAMPSYKTKKVDTNNRPIYQDVSYPITKEFREVLFSEILEKYARVKDKKINGASEEKVLDDTQKNEEQEHQVEQNDREPIR